MAPYKTWSYNRDFRVYLLTIDMTSILSSILILSVLDSLVSESLLSKVLISKKKKLESNANLHIIMPKIGCCT